MNSTDEIEAKFAKIEEINKKGSFSELPMNTNEMMDPPNNFIPAAQSSIGNINVMD